MKLISQNTTQLKKSKNFEIELDKGIIIKIWKYVSYDNIEDDADWDYQTLEDKKIATDWVDKCLDEDDDYDEDELHDFINNLSMWE